MLKKKSPLPRISILLLTILADLYGLAISFGILVWLLIGERIFYVNLFINLMPIILLPAIVCLIMGAVFRKWHTLIFNVLPILVLIVVYNNLFIPPKPAPESTDTITVFSYNLFDERHDFDTLDTILQQANADMIALQEVTVEAVDYLKNYQPEAYPYHRYTVFEADHHGEFLLSRWPIIEATETRPFRSVVETPYGTIAIYDVHLTYPLESGLEFGTRWHHHQRFKAIMDVAQAETYPTILIGAFNISQATAEYRQLRTSFEDVFRETNMGFGFTYPNFARKNDLRQYIPPVLRIEYIFATPDIIPIESRVIYQGDSDHFPLWAKVAFGEE